MRRSSPKTMSICLASVRGSAAGKRWARIPTLRIVRAGGVFAFGRPMLRASTLSVNSTIGMSKPTRWCPCIRALSGRALFPVPSRASSINTSSRPTRAKSSIRPIRMPLRPSALRVPPACCGPSMVTSGTMPRGSSAAPNTITCRSRSTSTRCILARGSATATRRRASPTSTATIPAPWIPSPRSVASSTPTTICRWSSWTTCATWAIRISRSCRLWSIPSMAPGATRRPATTPPRRATATRSSSCTLSMRATRLASA